jgi:hypothetical protein
VTTLTLKRANASRPSGQWSDEDYDVLADGKVVGRIYEDATAALPALRWFWSVTAITGIAGCCCAPAASGHAAAPPSSATNSRRPMLNMGGPSLRGYLTLSLPPGLPVGPWGGPELF